MNNNTDPRIERYLGALEARLKPFPVGDRAEIVTEIKSHILSALERDPSANLDQVLAALGEPETVANRYLLERGLKPVKPPISPIVKWLVIGFLGTVAMVLVFAGFLVTKVVPLVKVDQNKVGILNDFLEVEEDAEGNGRFSIKGIFSAGQFRGDLLLSEKRAVSVKFSNAKISLETADDESFSWNCEGAGAGSPQAELRDGVAELDLSRMIGVQCQLSIPKNARLKLDGVNGKVELNQPRFHLDARIVNGKVSIDPAEGVDYDYDLKVGGEKKTEFPAAKKPGAYVLNVELSNGKISREK